MPDSPPPATLWDDDPAERRRRLEAAVAYHRAVEAEDATAVLFVPAVAFHLDRAARGADVRAAAEWALRVAADRLALPVTPALRWFRLATPSDRASDWPEGEAFRSEPGTLGVVRPRDPGTVWLNLVFAHAPPDTVRPSLQEVVAHEAQHVKDLLRGRGGYGRALLEHRATAAARALLRGAPVPY